MKASLPRGWAWTEVEGLCETSSDITDGPFGSNLKTEHYVQAGPRVIRLQNIADGYFLDERAHVSFEHFDRLRKHDARPGDVVVAMLGSELPRACVVPNALGPAIVKADCARIRPNPLVVEGHYLSASLNSWVVRSQAEALVHGVGRPRLGLGRLRTLRVPLAPFEEQRRIVEALDSYLSRLDAAVASLERVQAKLKAYRASVLKAAVEGRLVPTEASLARKEKRDYEPAWVLLERILVERRRRWEEAELSRLRKAGKTPTDDKWKAKYKEPEPPDTSKLPPLPEGWCWASVDQVGDVLLGRQRAPQFLTGKHARPYLRVANIKDDAIDFSDIESMDFDEIHFEKYRLIPGDILVSEGQSPHLVGQSAIYTGGIDGLCFQKTLHRFRAVLGGPSGAFAQLIFRANVKLGVYKALAPITTNIAHLTLEKFKASRFPLAPQAEQARVAAEVERLMSIGDAVDRQAALDLARVARLRQSVLKWAFEGKLVDQDPNDEPASELLARIRAERESATPAKKPRSRKAKAS